MQHESKHRCKAALALAVALSGLWLAGGARADEAKKYPDWNTLWNRGSPPGQWDPSKPKGLGQEAPLKPEYQKIHEQNIAKEKAGIDFDIKATCGPVGMPRLMTAYEPIEIVITPKEVYMLAESMSPIRRIFTDGRDWPKDIPPTYAGYSIGRWIDDNGAGRYDVLEVETRGFKGPRAYDEAGLPLHFDNQSVFLEKFHLDKADPNILHDEVTVIDHALTRPWSVDRRYTHNPDLRAQWPEVFCVESNVNVVIGKENYVRSADGYLMPTKKDQAPPDLRYFKQPQK